MINYIKNKFREARYARAWRLRDDNSIQKYFEDETENRQVIRSVVNSLRPAVVYEFGCYSGPNLKHINCQVYGSDINPKAIEWVSKNIPDGRFITTRDLSVLDEWLPELLDVSLVIAVFYTMDRSNVVKTLELLAVKSKFIVLGDNFENTNGRKSIQKDGHFIHDWKNIIAPIGSIVHRSTVPTKDYALNEVCVIKVELPTIQKFK
jgi:hypothetical protein